MRDLSFRFDDERGDKEVLHGLTLTIRKGEHVGIRGASGAGKTTLFNLLLGFYTPTGGEITIDGEPLTAANRRRWQNAVGYVSQHVFLLDGTLLENIALGEEEEKIDRRRAEESLRAARLEDFVQSLSAGIDTPIGEAGNKLSGGQRQAPANEITRLSILRAVGSLLPSCPPAFAYDSDLQDRICRTLSDILTQAPVWHLACLPDKAAAELSYATVLEGKQRA